MLNNTDIANQFWTNSRQNYPQATLTRVARTDAPNGRVTTTTSSQTVYLHSNSRKIADGSLSTLSNGKQEDVLSALMLYFDTTGAPAFPKSGDQINYRGSDWRVTNVSDDPAGIGYEISGVPI